MGRPIQAVKRHIEKDVARELDERDMERMGIGELHWRAQFDLIPDGIIQKRVLARFIDSIQEHVFEGRGLLFHGEYSSGKTAAACILMKEVVKRRGTAFYISAMDLADAVIGRERFDADDTIAGRISKVDILTLDELGGSHSDKSGWGVSYIEKVVRKRTAAKKSTICITNLPIKELAVEYGDGLLAIMGECMFPVRFDGDWRKDKRDVLSQIFGDE